MAKAMRELRRALRQDADYADGWHANLAMMCYDSIRNDPKIKCSDSSAHRVGNEAARRFMKLAFDVKT